MLDKPNTSFMLTLNYKLLSLSGFLGKIRKNILIANCNQPNDCSQNSPDLDC